MYFRSSFLEILLVIDRDGKARRAMRAGPRPAGKKRGAG